MLHKIRLQRLSAIKHFLIGATFEMRTTLIRNQKLWGESKLAERQRERERERGRVSLKMSDDMGNKFDH
jgi:hypothetical protein